MSGDLARARAPIGEILERAIRQEADRILAETIQRDPPRPAERFRGLIPWGERRFARQIRRERSRLIAQTFERAKPSIARMIRRELRGARP